METFQIEQENFLAKQMKFIMKFLSKEASKDKKTKGQVSFSADGNSDSSITTSDSNSNYFKCNMQN